MLQADDSRDSCVLDAGAVVVGDDDSDALEPFASGMAEHAASGQIPNAQQAQSADTMPEVSDGVQCAASEVRTISSRHLLCMREGHVLCFAPIVGLVHHMVQKELRFAASNLLTTICWLRYSSCFVLRQLTLSVCLGNQVPSLAVGLNVCWSILAADCTLILYRIASGC